MRVLTAIVFLTLTAAAQAQIVGVEPASPTSADSLVLAIATPQAGLVLQPITRSGSQIDVTFRGGDVFPVTEVQRVALGPLPAGAYSIVVTFVLTDDFGEVINTVVLPPFTLSVAAAAPVPAAGELALVVLALALGVAALFAMRRV